MLLTADFETTTDPLDCRVWAYGLCEVGNPLYFKYGKTVNELMEFCNQGINHTLYFHNLKFDGEFILIWLFENGFTHVTDRKDITSKTFTTLISDKNQFYSLEIIFKKKGKHISKVTIYDSLKIIPFSVKDIAIGFNLPIKKGEIDYNKIRPVDYDMDDSELDYLKNDVTIISMALQTLFNEELVQMTQGSNALHDYKRILTKKRFDKLFPVPDYDRDIRLSYKGGFTYLNPNFKGVDVKEGIVLDVNSLYPSVMYYQPLPYGEGEFFTGKYKPDKIYNLYTQSFTCQFELKEGYIPTIQLKGMSSFVPTEYVTSSNGEDITLTLTNVDLKLFFEHYNVYNIEYHSGWKFKSTIGLFKDYIDKWNGRKVQATLDKNKAMRTLAKLMLNALYGKFALNPRVQGKIPFYYNGMIKYKLGEEEQRKPIYIPIGTFITSWARYKTISSAQQVYDRFVYADTDSLHLIGTDLPEGLEISPTDLGAWKHESTFIKARFLRQKSYMEKTLIDEKEFKELLEAWVELTTKNDNLPKECPHLFNENNEFYHLKITCAGMPEKCYPYVTWDNFKTGEKFKGKLMQTHVKGGIVLKDTDFTIKK